MNVSYIFFGLFADDYEEALKKEYEAETAKSELEDCQTSDPTKNRQLPFKRVRRRWDSYHTEEENDGIKLF